MERVIRYLKISNPKTNFCKLINTAEYTADEVDEIIVFYTNAKYTVEHIVHI
jgi:hypothetical protein